MPKTSTIPKESRLSIRASEPEKAILAQAAQARRMNTSQFVLQASLDAAHAVLIDQTEFRLPHAQMEESPTNPLHLLLLFKDIRQSLEATG
jgi:uncharacterized protein (DUF1778 family)